MHPHMIFDIDECEELSSLRNKTTILMTTCQAPTNFLLWSVFSFLLRSKPNGFLEHLNIAINGPDKRTGSTALQDEKQSFLEDLRNLKWKSRVSDETKDMPITVIRAWSRVGADQSMEMAATWAHTDSYIYAHDDLLLLKRDWESVMMDGLYRSPKVAIVYSKPLLQGTHCVDVFNGEYKLNYPHLNAYFIGCRKGAVAKAGVRWAGYHIKKEFKISDLEDVPEFLRFSKEYYKDLSNVRDVQFGYLSQDFGAWLYYKLKSQNYEMIPIENNLVYHFGSMSWGGVEKNPISDAKHLIDDLEKDIYEFKDYWNLYKKYKKNSL